ncbi:degenerin unc-8-like [Gigantopelta aegis]|uniref:degenerin unc-8-like n=1 Tax=Gigantopelta aegis TaxID=1735272 RepID=UPI001B888020|nr:degenerin unc-8-like [Gigantopelta aegis]
MANYRQRNYNIYDPDGADVFPDTLYTGPPSRTKILNDNMAYPGRTDSYYRGQQPLAWSSPRKQQISDSSFERGYKHSDTEPSTARQSDDTNSAMRAIAVRFAENTSMVGVPYIHHSTAWYAKLAWVLFLLAGLGAMTFHLYHLSDTYFAWPKHTTVVLGFESLKFPAITVCNINPVKMSQLYRGSPQFQQLLDSVRAENMAKRIEQQRLGAANPPLEGQAPPPDVGNGGTGGGVTGGTDGGPTGGAGGGATGGAGGGSTGGAGGGATGSAGGGSTGGAEGGAKGGTGSGATGGTDGGPTGGAGGGATGGAGGGSTGGAGGEETGGTRSGATGSTGGATGGAGDGSTGGAGSGETGGSGGATGGGATGGAGGGATGGTGGGATGGTGNGATGGAGGGQNGSTGGGATGGGATGDAGGGATGGGGGGATGDAGNGSTSKPPPRNRRESRTKRFVEPDYNYTNPYDVPPPPRPGEEDTWRNQGKKIAQAQMVDDFVSIYSSMKRKTRIEMGHHIRDMLIKCSFAGRECVAENFTISTTTTFGNCFTLQYDQFISRRSGPQEGLELWLNLEKAEFLRGWTNGDGLHLAVHELKSLPMVEQDGIAISAGTETFVALQLLNIERLGPPYGECNDGVEFHQLYGLVYSRQVCQMFCEQSLIIEYCGCIDGRQDEVNVQMKVKEKYSPCRESDDILCMNEIKQDFEFNKKTCTCLNPCSETKYTKTLSARPWPSEEYGKVLVQEMCAKRNNETQCQQFQDYTHQQLSKDFVKLSIYFEDLNYENITEVIDYELSQFLSDIGGTIGLWIGLSVLSLCEVGQLLLEITLYFCNCKGKKKPRKNDSRNHK